MVSDDTINVCINTTLGLGLGAYNLQDDQEKEMIKKHDHHHLLPCLKLGLSPDKDSDQESLLSPDRRRKQKQEASCCGSYSDQEQVEVVSVSVSMYMSSRVSDHEDDDGPRKKLRLTKQQSATLEDTFKHHNTLNPKQKQFLAAQLSLRPRQVEVWFQNRRARTKLKQTEEECEELKKYCETLREENKKLHKELKALKLTSSFYMPPSICPSCERVITSSATNTNSTHDDVVGPNTRPFFMHPSSAC